MKTYRAKTGPLSQRVYYELSEIESICTDALRKVDLLPKKPEPIRIERFINKQFGLSPTYDDLPVGLLGFTRFGLDGAEEIVISRSLEDERSRVAERRISSTLAHEAGHILLHAHLFAFDIGQGTLIPGSRQSKIMCRGEHVLNPTRASSRGTRKGTYKGEWWEFQANQAMGALLLPRYLVQQALHDVLTPRGTFGSLVLSADLREPAARLIAETFEVNPAVARIRVAEMYPENAAGQLTL